MNGRRRQKFFHKIANDRKRSNTINSLRISNVEIFEQKELNDAFTKYYKDIFGTVVVTELRQGGMTYIS